METKIPVEIKVVKDPGDHIVPLLLKPLEVGWGDSSFVTAELERGSECYVALSHDGVLSYLWVTAPWVTKRKPCLGHLNCEFLLPGDTFYLFMLFTFPQYRGCRLTPALMTQAMRD